MPPRQARAFAPWQARACATIGGMTRTRQAVIVSTAAALAVCYAATLRGMFQQWSSDEDMSHGLVVPILALWIVWRERERWRGLPA